MIVRLPEQIKFYFERRSFVETPIIPRFSFSPDEGVPIDRPKGTVRFWEAKGTVPMKTAEFDLFEDFVWHDLHQGVDWFYAPHPRTRELVEIKLKGNPKPYEIRYSTPTEVIISCEVFIRSAC